MGVVAEQVNVELQASTCADSTHGCDDVDDGSCWAEAETQDEAETRAEADIARHPAPNGDGEEEEDAGGKLPPLRGLTSSRPPARPAAWSRPRRRAQTCATRPSRQEAPASAPQPKRATATCEPARDGEDRAKDEHVLDCPQDPAMSGRSAAHSHERAGSSPGGTDADGLGPPPRCDAG